MSQHSDSDVAMSWYAAALQSHWRCHAL